MAPLADSIDIERAQRLARRTDPETSQQVARRAAVRIRLAHAPCILGVLWKPMVPPEISALTGLSIAQIDRRRRELLDAGQIRLTGVERDGYEEWARVDEAFIRSSTHQRSEE